MLFRPWRGSRPLHMPLISLLDSLCYEIKAGCVSLGTSDAAYPGTLLLVGWSQNLHGKVGDFVVSLCF